MNEDEINLRELAGEFIDKLGIPIEDRVSTSGNGRTFSQYEINFAMHLLLKEIIKDISDKYKTI